jgi:hypothetical protein
MKVRSRVFVTDSYSRASVSTAAAGEEDGGSGIGLSRDDEARRGLILEDFGVLDEELPPVEEGEAVL